MNPGLTPKEQDDLRWGYVAEGKSIAQLSRDTGRARETIRNILKNPETEELRKAVLAERVKSARLVLGGNTDHAARSWVKAIDVAAKRGDHKPARDLLLSERVIEPIGETGSAVKVYVNTPGNVLVAMPTDMPRWPGQENRELPETTTEPEHVPADTETLKRWVEEGQ